MRGFVLGLIVCGLLACGKPQKRVDITLVNTTSSPITLRARAGMFSRDIKLSPGAVWSGWVPLVFKVREIRIEVKP